MDINHLYHPNNNGIYQYNLFKDFDDEIYTIKDLNQKNIELNCLCMYINAVCILY